jgi:hypothetical protein
MHDLIHDAPETEPTTVRYFQARRVVHDTQRGGVFNMEFFPQNRPAGPLPVRISERVLFTPDVGVHLCEATRSTFVQVLGYDAEFDAGVSEELREWWNEQLLEALTGDDDYYVHQHRLVEAYDANGPVTFTGYFPHLAFQGEYSLDDEGERDALGDAFANHLV